MIKKIKLMLLSMSYMFALLLPFGMAAPAYAALTPSETHDNLCKGSNLDLSAAAANCPANTGTSVTDLIKKIINILSVLIGAIAVVMIILGGFRYVKNTILYAIIGLVIVALAQVIVHFVLNNVNPS
jgi:hypothetical protein